MIAFYRFENLTLSEWLFILVAFLIILAAVATVIALLRKKNK